MRRRASRLIRRAGLIAPTLAVLAGAAQAMPASKDDRDHETTRAQARHRPSPGDMAPEDPVAAAFALFPRSREERRDEAASAGDDGAVTTVPTPPPVTEIEPGVVVVERVEAEPVAPVAAPVLGFAPALDPVPGAIDRLFVPPVTAARVLDVPIPRRRPVDLGARPEEGAMRLASLTPEPPKASETRAETAPIATEGLAGGEPKRIPKEALPYLEVMRREAAANKVPLWLAVGVGWVESKYNPRLRGTHGVVGLMQVMPSTARFQGYRGPTEKLLEAETNIVWGMRELGWDWAKSGGNPCLAIAKYKGGIATKSISSAAADYCRKAKQVTGML